MNAKTNMLRKFRGHYGPAISNETLLRRLWKGDKRYKLPRHVITVKPQKVRGLIILDITATFFAKDGPIQLTRTAFEIDPSKL